MNKKTCGTCIYLSRFLLLIGSRRNANLAIYIINHINLIALLPIAVLNMQLSPCRSLLLLFLLLLLSFMSHLTFAALHFGLYSLSLSLRTQHIKSIKASALLKSVIFTFLTLFFFCLFFVRCVLWFKAAAAQLTLGVSVGSDGDCGVSFTQLVGYGLRLRFNRVPWLISVLSYSHTHTHTKETHGHTHMPWLVNFSIIACLLSDIFTCFHLLRMSLCAFNLDFCVNKIRTHTRQTRHTHTHMCMQHILVCVCLSKKAFGVVCVFHLSLCMREW